jgi:hypothetical protein
MSKKPTNATFPQKSIKKEGNFTQLPYNYKPYSYEEEEEKEKERYFIDFSIPGGYSGSENHPHGSPYENPQPPLSQLSKTIISGHKVSKRYRFASKAGLLTYYSCQCEVSQVKLWFLDKFQKYCVVRVIISKQKLICKLDPRHGAYTKPNYVLRIYFKLKRRLDTRNVNFFDIPSVVSKSSYHPVVMTDFSNERSFDAFRRKSDDHNEVIQRLLSYHAGRLNDETMLFVDSNTRKGPLMHVDQFTTQAIARRKERALEVLRKKKVRYPLLKNCPPFRFKSKSGVLTYHTRHMYLHTFVKLIKEKLSHRGITNLIVLFVSSSDKSDLPPELGLKFVKSDLLLHLSEPYKTLVYFTLKEELDTKNVRFFDLEGCNRSDQIKEDTLYYHRPDITYKLRNYSKTIRSLSNDEAHQDIVDHLLKLYKSDGESVFANLFLSSKLISKYPF